MREKIHMYDQCVIALGYDPDMEGQSEKVEDLIEFLDYEGCELRDELQEFEDGTHATWAPFKEMLSSNDPDAVVLRYRGAQVIEKMKQSRRDMQRLSDIASSAGHAFDDDDDDD
jgi:hypothetical protein